MGYEVERFVGNVDEELKCPICLMVLENPIQTICEHFYCRNCILRWLSKDLHCPVDVQPLTVAGLQQPSRLLRNLLGKLAIRCRFHRIGCREIVRLDNLENHCAKCYFNPDAEVTCDKGCQLKMTRREYREKDCITHCFKIILSQQTEIGKLRKELHRRKCTGKENCDKISYHTK